MNAIELQHVSKYFGSNVAVDQVALAVPAGQIVSLLGPSGCGKTTTLRLIAGFEAPDAGRILLGGRPVAGDAHWVPPEHRGIGMVFQDYALFPHLTVRQNLAFGLPAGGRDHHLRVEQILHLVGLQKEQDRYPHELSGGQQQRVALGRALTPNPAVILLDEPLSNLDADLKIRMRGEMKAILKATGATAIFVTHDQQDALAISDQIVVLAEGRVQQKGSPRDIYQFPANRFVAEFVGKSNLLEGIIAEDGRGLYTDLGLLPCDHTHDEAPGASVLVSVRPESLEYHPGGTVAGRVLTQTYTGQSIDVLIEAEGKRATHQLHVHVHPEERVHHDQILRFRVIPDFVAVVGDSPR